MMNWVDILGFEPEKTFEVQNVENKCYKCNSNDVIELESDSWTAKCQCRHCGYISFAIYQDKMGGATLDDVAIYKPYE